MRRHQFAVERPAVLFVDDEPHLLSSIERVLARQGIKVHVALNPDEARALLPQIDVQVVCSDINMGKENGIAFLRWVREHYPKLQRILLTAYASQTEYLTGAINEAGVHRFLGKPFDQNTFIMTLKQSIEQWAIVDERDALLDVTARQNESLLRLNNELETANADLEMRVAERTRQIEDAAQMWRRTFDSIAEPMIVIDEHFRVRRANQSAAELAAIDDVKKLMGRSCHEALFGKSSQCERCPLRSTDDVSEWEDPRSERLWSVSAWRLRETDDGRPWQVIRYHDVTEQRQMQAEVARMERMAMLGQMASGVAHELNNPLTGIISFSQLIGRSLERPDQQSMVQEIVTQARRCSDIANQLLDFSRKGSKAADVRLLDVAALIAGCERQAGFQLGATDGVELSFECEPGLRPVMGSQVNLESVVLNLVRNAVQAMGGVGRVAVAARAGDERTVNIQVTDSGPGVPEAIKDQIFEPFFTTKAANRQGTGLGLAIVSDIVRDHRGTVSIENLPEGGARFTVSLPTTVV